MVLNIGEGQTVPRLLMHIKTRRVLAMQGKLEMDIAQLPPQEAEVFLQEYHIQEPSLQRMIKLIL